MWEGADQFVSINLFGSSGDFREICLKRIEPEWLVRCVQQHQNAKVIGGVGRSSQLRDGVQTYVGMSGPIRIDKPLRIVWGFSGDMFEADRTSQTP